MGEDDRGSSGKSVEPVPALGEFVVVNGPDGSSARVALYGGHVVSWQTADGNERLFLSTLATRADGAAIRGGVPVCFPQFAANGPLPKHGFARTTTWRQEGDGTFSLTVPAGSWPGWPHTCRLTLSVGLGPATLTISLTVENPGTDAFSFTGALHTYLRCEDVTNARISGLDGCRIHGDGSVQGDITFGDGSVDVDLAVLDAWGPVEVSTPGGPPSGKILCAQTGFPDVVVWNIGRRLGSAMADLGPGEWQSYVCVESAVVGAPVRVGPAESWHGSQTLVAIDRP